jgi:hypothetical protein
VVGQHRWYHASIIGEKTAGRFASIDDRGGAASPDATGRRCLAARRPPARHIRIRSSFSFHTRPAPTHVPLAGGDDGTPDLFTYLSSIRHPPTATTHRRRRGPRSHIVVARALRCPAPRRPVLLHCAYMEPNISIVCAKEARRVYSSVVSCPACIVTTGLG